MLFATCRLSFCRRNALCLAALLPLLFVAVLFAITPRLVRPDVPLCISATLTLAFILALSIEAFAVAVANADEGTALWHLRQFERLAWLDFEATLPVAVRWLAVVLTVAAGVTLLALLVTAACFHPLTVLCVVAVAVACVLGRLLIDNRERVAEANVRFSDAVLFPAAEGTARFARRHGREVLTQAAGWAVTVAATAAVMGTAYVAVTFALAHPLPVALACAVAGVTMIAVGLAPLASKNADLMYADLPDLGIKASIQGIRENVGHATETVKGVVRNYVETATVARIAKAQAKTAKQDKQVGTTAGMDVFSSDPKVYEPAMRRKPRLRSAKLRVASASFRRASRLAV